MIAEDGEKLGVMNKAKAINFATERDLDLVVVSSAEAKPLVCKLMNYSKYRYEQQRKLREMKKNQRVVELKEIRLSPTIDKHDFETKLRHAIRFIDHGDKVKISIRFYGRMITHRDVGEQVIKNFIEAIGEKAQVEAKPKMDGRSMVAVIAPATNN